MELGQQQQEEMKKQDANNLGQQELSSLARCDYDIYKVIPHDPKKPEKKKKKKK